jgi:hypothetical protein
MNWKNVDLKSDYERSLYILDSYSFDTLLLEIACNIKNTDINHETVLKQFETSLMSKINSAWEIFNSNLDNIVDEAIEHSKNV